jgi:CBS domain-containing protein
MTRRLVALSPETEILQAMNTLVEKNISGAPVIDEDGRVIGILTNKDCLKVAFNATYHSQYGGVVADLMTTSVVTVSPDDAIISLAERFLKERYHRYPVVEDGRLVGVISRQDVVRALGAAWQWTTAD